MSTVSSLKLRKFLEKSEWLFEKLIHNFSDFHNLLNHWVQTKNVKATLLFINFSQAFDSLHRGKIEQIAYGFAKETVFAIMTLFKNIKAMVCSCYRSTSFNYLVFGVWSEEPWAPYLFIICLKYIFWMSIDIDLMKENGFTIKKAKSRQYPIIESNHTDYLALLANTPAPAESLLHSLDQAAGGISLFMNPNKIEFVCFKQKGTTSTQSGELLKLVNQFKFYGSNISSTERDVNICLAKVWDAINSLSVT